MPWSIPTFPSPLEKWRGTPLNYGYVCAAKGSKTLPYSRMKQTEIDPLFKTQWREGINFISFP